MRSLQKKAKDLAVAEKAAAAELAMAEKMLVLAADEAASRAEEARTARDEANRLGKVAAETPSDETEEERDDAEGAAATAEALSAAAAQRKQQAELQTKTARDKLEAVKKSAADAQERLQKVIAASTAEAEKHGTAAIELAEKSQTHAGEAQKHADAALVAESEAKSLEEQISELLAKETCETEDTAAIRKLSQQLMDAVAAAKKAHLSSQSDASQSKTFAEHCKIEMGYASDLSASPEVIAKAKDASAAAREAATAAGAAEMQASDSATNAQKIASDLRTKVATQRSEASTELREAQTAVSSAESSFNAAAAANRAVNQDKIKKQEHLDLADAAVRDLETKLEEARARAAALREQLASISTQRNPEEEEEMAKRDQLQVARSKFDRAKGRSDKTIAVAAAIGV
jgi:hypothetical protein